MEMKLNEPAQDDGRATKKEAATEAVQNLT